ncbi:hypothetical protein [Acinetobacter colistiniresistens]|uniref:Uncharacterized protein n=2 Tax=Acinetobacter colistiniresistens TaxID=280145 RepID=S3T821_9GAMM|nr:hypothetical protein [Acinetobacter colistiniresistens]EPG37053.1 hypothetical protein F907_02318 [Acinetobacter colistiniresistens]TVT79879.1 hypothetical protein FPV60_13660 [Acinetobacter colistiniresistens]
MKKLLTIGLILVLAGCSKTITPEKTTADAEVQMPTGNPTPFPIEGADKLAEDCNEVASLAKSIMQLRQENKNSKAAYKTANDQGYANGKLSQLEHEYVNQMLEFAWESSVGETEKIKEERAKTFGQLNLMMCEAARK